MKKHLGEWLIDYDHLENKITCITGPVTQKATINELRNGTKFKMYDDDGVLYYSGYLIESDGDEMLNPLIHYGRPGAGCTEIRVLKNGAWRCV